MKMNKFFILVLLMALSKSSFAYADEEESYDDLVNRLQSVKSHMKSDSSSTIDDLKLHMGAGLITSMSNVSYTNKSETLNENGFQVSLGIDMFSPNLIAEGIIRNFGETSNGSEKSYLREYDFCMLYKTTPVKSVSYQFGIGLGTRELKINDDPNGVAIDQSTPTAVFTAGFNSAINKYVSLGLELGARTAMTADTVDKSSFDLSAKIDTTF